MQCSCMPRRRLSPHRIPLQRQVPTLHHGLRTASVVSGANELCVSLSADAKPGKRAYGISSPLIEYLAHCTPVSPRLTIHRTPPRYSPAFASILLCVPTAFSAVYHPGLSFLSSPPAAGWRQSLLDILSRCICSSPVNLPRCHCANRYPVSLHAESHIASVALRHTAYAPSPHCPYTPRDPQ